VKHDILLVLLGGGLTLVATIASDLLNAKKSSAAEKDRREAEDARRWQGDRRAIYAKYLGLASVMLREIDGIACFLPYNGDEPLSAEDDEVIKSDLFKYMVRWDDELQPALGELQLLASREVADLADRISGALIDLTSNIEKRDSFKNHYPMWFQADDLLSVLRQAMRRELGVSGELEPQRRSPDWPWLPDRPPGSSYVQKRTSES
jgi:hypothetical protein